MRIAFLLSSIIILTACNSAQSPSRKPYSQEDEKLIKQIFDEELTAGHAYENLRSLCKDVGHRLSGSENAELAVIWGEEKLKSYGLDSVWKQPCMVTHWERGEAEVCYMQSGDLVDTLAVLALGGSIASPEEGIMASVIEVHNFEQLDSLGEQAIRGKIVFFNRPMDQKMINTFKAYGGCVNQRSSGASEAAPYGALAVLVRSMSTELDDYPHTGVMSYREGVRKIPAVALSTLAATRLSNALKKDPSTQVYLKTSSKNFEDAPSHNVIAEIRGSEYPDEIILVGGHLDSWDVGEGAHDDGAGVVQSIEVLRLMKAVGYKPKRTIRAVLYMNEENGAKGAKHYADLAKQKGEKHIAALESDRGGFAPRGFNFQSDEKTLAQFKGFADLFQPYYADRFTIGYGGVDIGFLKDQGTLLIGYEPDSQRYFKHHHAATDVFESVDKRELQLGAASITALLYLIDKYGLDF